MGLKSTSYVLLNMAQPQPRIAYIILTCEKYVNTRVPWQLNTTLRNVSRDDIYYLAHTMDEERRLFSWGADDSYNGLPYKYTDFFRYSNLTGYDWYVLMDDDTYVFRDRLIKAVAPYYASLPLAMGCTLTHVAHTQWGAYFSGGAGTVLSRACYELLSHYVQNTTNIGELVPHWCADICIGIWMRRHPQIQQVHNPHFHPENIASAPLDLPLAITYHHLKTWEEYDECYAIHMRSMDGAAQENP